MILRPSMFPHFCRFVGKTIWQVLTGKQVMVSQDIQKKRLDVCRGCKYFSGHQCRICDCYMKLKVAFYSESCPLPRPKWN